MSYLIYVAILGTVATLFLWIRDARIFFRTGLSGYRKAAYWGILYGALASLGAAFTLSMPGLELLGLGLILLALYLQGKIERERVWNDEGTLERLLGSVPYYKTNKK
jgi:hypothetical protein